jgi:hypothetical protein
MKLFTAFLSFGIASSNVVYWLIFWFNNESLAKIYHKDFINKYISSFPYFLQPFFPVYATLICFLLFILSGSIFIKQRKRPYQILAIFSFILSAWMLFSLM